MTLEQELLGLNLTKSEIKVYLYVLENGLSTPPEIAKGTSIARTNCYNILGSLKENGLIEQQEKKNRKVYIAMDPEALLRSVQKKQEVIERLLPDLRVLHATQKNKPKIRFYDGFEQVKEIYWQATETDKLFAIGSTKKITEQDPKFFFAFEKKLKDNHVMVFDLITNSSQQVGIKETQEILKELYVFKTLPAKYTDFPTDILVWKDHIALITLSEPIFGTIITSPLLAQTFRFVFEMIWDGTK